MIYLLPFGFCLTHFYPIIYIKRMIYSFTWKHHKIHWRFKWTHYWTFFHYFYHHFSFWTIAILSSYLAIITYFLLFIQAIHITFWTISIYSNIWMTSFRYQLKFICEFLMLKMVSRLHNLDYIMNSLAYVALIIIYYLFLIFNF